MSPYIKNPERLGDVIAAIQAMAVFREYKLSFEGWSDRITGSKENGPHWETIFRQHPEFFRLDGRQKKASLVWRRQYPRRFHIVLEKILSKEEILALPEDDQDDKISRAPLTPSDINALIKVAIDLHSRALESKKDSRWWIPVAAAIGSLLGAIGGAILKSII